MKIFKFFFALTAFAVIAFSCSPKDPTIVKTRSGLVQGIYEDGTMAFKGIPYAKIERFMPPQKPDRWKGVRICDHFGPQVMQNTRTELPDSLMSEFNSCVLNVWTTDTKASKPVMLWIHGGGFDSGSAAGNPGMGLAKEGVVLVSLNHRLNILGFLDLSRFGEKYKYSGNVGMLDIVTALEWIRDNISCFGGDPSNVTIFGESGGGGKVSTLLAMPQARGLFHKAIIQSGTILNVNTKQMTEELGEAVLAQLGIAPEEVDRIAEVPYRELVAAGQRAMAASIGTRSPGTPMMWGFGPTPDGETVLEQPFQPGLCALSSDIPILIGTTLHELQRSSLLRDLTLEQVKEELLPTFGDRLDEYVSAFAEAYPDAAPQELLSIDMMFRPKTVLTADSAYEIWKAPIYSYMFTRRDPVTKVSAHGSELAFNFNTLFQVRNKTEEDQTLADNMSRAWVSFATCGNPNVDGLPEWHPYEPEKRELMVFDHECEIRYDFDRHLQEVLNACCFKQLDEFYKTH